MSPLASPIHVDGVGVANLRFFAPPAAMRQFPWVPLDDLYACLSVRRQMRRAFRQDMRSGPFADEVRTVATADGIETLVPHFVAQGIIDALIQLGQVGDGTRNRYAVESAAAMKVLTEGMSKAEVLAYLGEAMRASGGPE